MAEKMTRGQVQDLLAKFATENPKYREALVANPKAIIEKQFALSLGNVTVKAVVETADTTYVVVPYAASEGELSADTEGRKICVAYVDPAGTETDRTISRTLTGAASYSALSTTPCFADGQADTARRVQVLVERSGHIDTGFYRIPLTMRRPAAYRLPELQSLIGFGASPRASIALAQAARAHAFLQGRAYTTPDDVKALAHDVLRHRIVTTYEAEAEELTTDDLIDRVLDGVDVP